MSPTTIFLVGAPTFSSLRWDEGGLLSESIPPFQSLNAAGEIGAVSPETDAVKWRLLRRPIIPETPQTTALSEAPGAAQFLITHDLATSNTVQTVISEDSELSQFYDHSFTIHETSEFSDLGPPTQDSVLGSSLWAASTETSLATNDEGETPPLRPSIRGGVTNLQDIPSASYLISIEPQTMTVNIIVAIITIRPPRRIVTRQWGKELDLIEAVVGDETRTGFGVTFWLPPQSDGVATHGSDNQRGEDLRKALMLLRPRDIVLLRTIGLSTFRERVYGQSLRRGLTMIDLLHRQQVDATDAGGIYKLRDILNHAAKNDELPLLKVRKVHEWIRRYVDSVPDAAGGIIRPRGAETLPPDTQEDTL